MKNSTPFTLAALLYIVIFPAHAQTFDYPPFEASVTWLDTIREEKSLYPEATKELVFSHWGRARSHQ